MSTKSEIRYLKSELFCFWVVTGDFNVAEHIEDDESNAYKISYTNSILFGFQSLFVVFTLLF